MITEVNSINTQRARERLVAFSTRIAAGYAEVPVEEGLAEIDAACSPERATSELRSDHGGSLI